MQDIFAQMKELYPEFELPVVPLQNQIRSLDLESSKVRGRQQG